MFEWITGTVEAGGYWGVFGLMFLENLFPPIPSEVIMPLAGFTAAQGSLSAPGVLAAGVLGSLAGAFFWYAAGYWFGIDKLKWFSRHFGRVMTVSPDEIDAASEWFRRHGRAAVLFGRLVPTVRTLISVPAGLTKMPLAPFALYTSLGTVIWTAALMAAGYVLESQYEKVGEYVDPLTNVVIAVFVGVYLYRLVTWKKPGPGTVEAA